MSLLIESFQVFVAGIVSGDTLMLTRCQAPASAGIPLASEFCLPILNLDQPWYEATRRYGRYNYHPERCEDWNLESGGNTDLGEPLVAPFAGLVLSAHEWGGGVGKVIQILGLTLSGSMVVWAGWHLHEMSVWVGQVVQMGQEIGSIGNANGRYAGAHLHEQICILDNTGVPMPTTFASDNRYNWQQPSAFYVAHGVGEDLMRRVTAYDGA